METADARTNMQISWALVALGVALVAAGVDVPAVVLIGIAQYFRNMIGDEKPRLEEVISFHPAWKWFTVAYYLVVAGLALHFMSELHRLSVGVSVLVFVFPLAVAWIRYDWLLYQQLKSA
jgi:hypothetical protein